MVRATNRGGRRALLARGRVRLVVLGALVIALIAWTVDNARQAGPWQRVLATREGMIGGLTASGMTIKPDSMFVALPHPSALRRTVEVRYRDRVVVVPVLDVGPWNVNDAYWERGDRPASERGKGVFRVPVNRAGIDLSDAVFAALGLRDNDLVDWRFVHRGYLALPRL